MKIIFAGTPELAVPSLQALIDSKHEVIAVYTKPDQPAGRGQKLTASPIKALALQHQISVRQPLSLRDLKEQELLSSWQADIMVVIAYGLILPKAALEIPRFGCINIHVSLLPRWRGASPIQQAILAGDSETGVTIMQMDEGLDTGPILAQFPTAIGPTDSSLRLHNRLAQRGAEALLLTLPKIFAGNCPALIQNESQACYAGKITKHDAEINWLEPAEIIHRKIRAFNPWPIAYTYLNDQPLRIWQADIIATSTTQPPGTIVSASKNGIEVATGQQLLRLLMLQLPGGRSLPVNDLLNARAELWVTGKRLGK